MNRQHKFLAHPPGRPRNAPATGAAWLLPAVLAPVGALTLWINWYAKPQSMEQVIAIHDPGTAAQIVPSAPAENGSRNSRRDAATGKATATVDACVSGIRLGQALRKPRPGEDTPHKSIEEIEAECAARAAGGTRSEVTGDAAE